jgi:hypothetical protein
VHSVNAIIQEDNFVIDGAEIISKPTSSLSGESLSERCRRPCRTSSCRARPSHGCACSSSAEECWAEQLNAGDVPELHGAAVPEGKDGTVTAERHAVRV